MHKLSLIGAVLGTSLAAFAQTCNGAPAARTIATLTPFGADFYGGGGTPSMAEYFDLSVNSSVSITAFTKTTYDQGVGNPPTPNQVGNTAVVNVYVCTTTWAGNQTISPSAPGTPWILAGTGTLTVTAWPAASPVVLAAPITLAAGSYGVALETRAPTAGTSPGPLHVLYKVSTLTVSDQFVNLGPQAVQGTAFSSGVAPGNINMTMTYVPNAAAALYTSFGTGCYVRPRAFFEDFPASPTAPDLSNTGINMVLLGQNYLVVAVPPNFVPPTGTSLTLSPPGASSSGNWDDATSTPIALPFTFSYPGGSTNTITIGSNGYVFLDSVTAAGYGVNGASYGSLASFRDNAARIAPYFHDLDPTAGGGIFYEVDPSNTFVRVTWNQIPEWPVPTALNTMQVTLHANGNVDISYGALANTGVANGNNAIAGFTPGNGSTLPASQDLSATMPFQSGDGSVPPVLTMAPSGSTPIGRPVLGTTPNIVTSNITPGTSFVFLVMGFVASGTGLDLTPFGLPGCRDYVTPVTNILGPVVAGQSTFGLSIPNNPALQNVQVYAQSAPLTPGLNPAGILTSNAICMKVGQ